MSRALLITFVLAAFTPFSAAVDLRHETLKAWSNYVAQLEQQTAAAAKTPETFLAVDRSPDLRSRVLSGEIVVGPAIGSGSEAVPSGLIHDWIGSVFIPSASLETLLDLVQNYSRYPEIYRPTVKHGQLIRKDASTDLYRLLIRQKVLFLDVALDGEYRSIYHRLGPCKAYSTTSSQRLQGIINPGTADEKRDEQESGSGLIWRLESILKFEQAEGGVFVQWEAVALSRSVPVFFRGVVNPVVSRISRSALATSLQQTRDANVAPHEDSASSLFSIAQEAFVAK